MKTFTLFIFFRLCVLCEWIVNQLTMICHKSLDDENR